MGWRAVVSENGKVTGYRETSTGERISVAEFERRHMMEQSGASHSGSGAPGAGHPQLAPMGTQGSMQHPGGLTIEQPRHLGSSPLVQPGAVAVPVTTPPVTPQEQPNMPGNAQGGFVDATAMPIQQQGQMPAGSRQMPMNGQEMPSSGMPTGRTLREVTGAENHDSMVSHLGYERHGKGFIDATSVTLLLPSLGLIVVFIIIVTIRVKKIRKQRQAAKELAEKQGKEV